jgi:hypothetical protein
MIQTIEELPEGAGVEDAIERAPPSMPEVTGGAHPN